MQIDEAQISAIVNLQFVLRNLHFLLCDLCVLCGSLIRRDNIPTD